jgi:hypothetical protein
MKGRTDLYDLALTAVSARGRRAELIQDPSDETRKALTLVCAYAAYLTGAHDSEYRKAYDLLYAMESLNKEADELTAQRQQEAAEAEAALKYATNADDYEDLR